MRMRVKRFINDHPHRARKTVRARASDTIDHARKHQLVIAGGKLPQDTRFTIDEGVELNPATNRVETNPLLLNITATDTYGKKVNLPPNSLTLRIYFAEVEPPVEETDLVIFHVASAEELDTRIVDGYAEAELQHLSTYTLAVPFRSQ